jgi:hypothetical protein
VAAAGGPNSNGPSVAAQPSAGGNGTTNTNAGNDRRGDTDTAPECAPGFGGDPCVHNGNSEPGVTSGHGNCDDNQGNGSHGNDNGNFRSCATAAPTTSTNSEQPTTTTMPTTTTTAHTSSTTTREETTTAAPTPTVTINSTPTHTSNSSTTTQEQSPAATSTTVTTTKATKVGGTMLPPATPNVPSYSQSASVALANRSTTMPAPPGGRLPFTGLPLWIGALAALGLLATGAAATHVARPFR